MSRSSLSDDFKRKKPANLLIQSIELTRRPLVGVKEHFSVNNTGSGLLNFKDGLTLNTVVERQKRIKSKRRENGLNAILSAVIAQIL